MGESFIVVVDESIVDDDVGERSSFDVCLHKSCTKLCDASIVYSGLSGVFSFADLHITGSNCPIAATPFRTAVRE